MENKINNLLLSVPNIIHDTVPVARSEKNNEILRSWQPNDFDDKKKYEHDHAKLLEFFEEKYVPDLKKKSSQLAGHRAYFLIGDIMKLQLALINYSMDYLMNNGFIPVSPPPFLKKNIMSKTAQLSDFEDQLYKIENQDAYLIATSEQPISAIHYNDILNKNDLPKKYCGLSPCFRKEAGARGKDVTGIFRVHYFDKIEIFCITNPDDSWNEFENIIKIVEKFYQSLNIPYRIVNIVSGGLNNAAAKKYDLEGLFPNTNRYRELVSCSNCTDFQSRKLNIKYANNLNKKNKYVHMLNSTLCATTRMISCILENYQEQNGIRIPSVLRSYFGNEKMIYF